MYRAWVVLLAGCGFQASSATSPDASAPSPPPIDVAPASSTWAFVDNNLGDRWQTDLPAIAKGSSVDITSETTIDTDTGISPDSAVTCMFATMTVAVNGGTETDDLCVILAETITIEPDHKLSAVSTKSTRPLALFAHTIKILGTLDVASHHQGTRGPGSLVPGCNSGTPSTNVKVGGNGGFFATPGGLGGNHDAQAGGSTIGHIFRGGCDGVVNIAAAAANNAGAGGGGVWIASDAGSLTLGAKAIINASGAGGLLGFAGTGGSGGGSGGMIVLQSRTITIASGAQIFANGGGGAGGGSSGGPGTDGADPADASSGGASGAGGSNPNAGGAGGAGYHATSGTPNAPGDGQSSGQGGGGGGGGAGSIRIDTESSVQQATISPPPAIARH